MAADCETVLTPASEPPPRRKLIAKGRYRAAAGTTVKAKLKLTRRGKALLKRKRVRAKLRVTVVGGVPATKVVRLR